MTVGEGKRPQDCTFTSREPIPDVSPRTNVTRKDITYNCGSFTLLTDIKMPLKVKDIQTLCSNGLEGLSDEKFQKITNKTKLVGRANQYQRDFITNCNYTCLPLKLHLLATRSGKH